MKMVMDGADVHRQSVLALIRTKSTLKAASIACGRNHGYFHQYLFQSKPRFLPEDVRIKLAQYLGIAENRLREPELFVSVDPPATQQSEVRARLMVYGRGSEPGIDMTAPVAEIDCPLAAARRRCLRRLYTRPGTGSLAASRQPDLYRPEQAIAAGRFRTCKERTDRKDRDLSRPHCGRHRRGYRQWSRRKRPARDTDRFLEDRQRRVSLKPGAGTCLFRNEKPRCRSTRQRGFFDLQERFSLPEQHQGHAAESDQRTAATHGCTAGIALTKRRTATIRPMPPACSNAVATVKPRP